MAEAHYAQIAPHLYCGPIEGAANVQIGACSPNFLIQECIQTWGGFHAEILKEPMCWEDGYIIPSEKPGIGVELDEEVAARHPYTGHPTPPRNARPARLMGRADAEDTPMKAAVCHAFGEPLVVEEVALDPPRDGEVKVRLAACAICHSDIHYIEGAWGGRLPVVCGHEASGAVDAVGAGVGHVKPGDHVVVTLIRSCGRCFYCVQGDPTQCETQFRLDAESPLHAADGRTVRHGLRTAAFAECVVVHESQVVQVPKSLPLDSASLLACGVITGVGAVTNTAKVPSGSSVVVIGTGGVGLNSVQGATLSGAKPIIAVDLADDKLAAAEAFGATHGVNPTAGDARDRVAALTGGAGRGLRLRHRGQRHGDRAGPGAVAQVGHPGGRRHARVRRHGGVRGGHVRRQRPAHLGQQDGRKPAASGRAQAGGAL